MPRFTALSQTSHAVRATSFGPFGQRIAELSKQGLVAPLHIGDTWLMPPEPAQRIALDVEAVHRYAPIAGLPPLREAVHARISERYGIPSQPEEVFLTPGSTGGLSLAAEALFDPGDEVIIMTPSWPLIFGMLERRGVVIREVPVSADGFPDGDIAALRERLEAACSARTAGLYFCDPNNPGGFIYSPEMLAALADFARSHDLWVISDVAYVDFCFDAPEFRPAAALEGFAGRTITAGTFSKSFALAGHRIGWLHVPEGPAELMTRLLTYSTYHTSTSAQEMALACLRADAGAEIWKSYEDGARVAHEVLEGRVRPAVAGAFVFLDLRPLGVKDHEGCLELLGRILEDGVALCPGRVFGRDFEGFARLCYTALPPEELRRALQRLRPYLDGTP